MPDCGRWNPGLWGFAPLLNRLGRDLGFTQFVIGGCICLYALMLISDPDEHQHQRHFEFLSPSPRSLFIFGESGRVPVFSSRPVVDCSDSRLACMQGCCTFSSI